MAALEYDVVFFDTVSSVYQENTPNERGIGGSELEVIILSQELAAAGFSVLILNDPIAHRQSTPDVREPIVSKSGVHYASCRQEFPKIECGTLILQRFSAIPSHDVIKRDHTVVWLHDACNNPNDATAIGLATATKASAHPVFVSDWQRGTYPQHAVGRHSRVIPNMVPRLLFDDRWRSTPQEDTMVYASAAVRGLDATLTAWADPRVAAGGRTILEIMGPVYDPPPDQPDLLHVKSESLDGRIRLRGSLPLPALVERLAASRGLLFVNTWPETFCLLVAYSEALGKPARFVAMSAEGFGGVREAMVNSKFLYKRNDWDRFLSDLAREISSDERLEVTPVRKFHPETVMPLWLDALGLEV